MLAFQPHRYTRTRDCFEDFVQVLSTVDALLLTDVYPAGEAPIVAADGRALARADARGGQGRAGIRRAGRRNCRQAILDAARDGDVVVTMGAGSIGAVPARLVERDQQRTGVRRMDMAELERIAQRGLGGEFRLNEPMRKHTSWRAGGPADRAYFPRDLEDLARFPAHRSRGRAGARRRARQQSAGARRRLARHGRSSRTAR